MNKQEKKAVAERFAAEAGKSKEKITATISGAEPNLKPKEVEEIVALIMAPPPPPDEQPAAKESLNKTYELYKVEPQYDLIAANPKKGIPRDYRELKEGEAAFEKLGKAVKTTRITPETADLLNAQSEQTKVRYYLVPDKKAKS